MSNFCAAVNTQSAAMPYSEPVGHLMRLCNIDGAWEALCTRSSLTGLPLAEGGEVLVAPTWWEAFAMYTGAARDGSSSLRIKWFPACVMHESQRYFQLRKRPAPLCPESMSQPQPSTCQQKQGW